MYAKLRYNLLHQRGQSSSCETLAGQMILYRLESIDGADTVTEQWRAKRDDYALAPAGSLPYLLLDYMYRDARGGGGSLVKLDVTSLNGRAQALALEFQRHWIYVVQRTRAGQDADTSAAALVAALNAGAWLDAFLWREANRERPINCF